MHLLMVYVLCLSLIMCYVCTETQQKCPHGDNKVVILSYVKEKKYLKQIFRIIIFYSDLLGGVAVPSSPLLPKGYEQQYDFPNSSRAGVSLLCALSLSIHSLVLIPLLLWVLVVWSGITQGVGCGWFFHSVVCVLVGIY